MCLAQGPQRSDAGEARTRGPSVSSQALYHWATALPIYTYIRKMNKAMFILKDNWVSILLVHLNRVLLVVFNKMWHHLVVLYRMWSNYGSGAESGPASRVTYFRNMFISIKKFLSKTPRYIKCLNIWYVASPSGSLPSLFTQTWPLSI